MRSCAPWAGSQQLTTAEEPDLQRARTEEKRKMLSMTGRRPLVMSTLNGGGEAGGGNTRLVHLTVGQAGASDCHLEEGTSRNCRSPTPVNTAVLLGQGALMSSRIEDNASFRPNRQSCTATTT